MNKILSKTFLWMFIGLVVTFLTGYVISTNAVMANNIFGGSRYILFIIAEFVLVIVLSARIFKMNPAVAKACFILYAFMSGLTFSSVFIVYELTSIMYVFLLAAGLFGILAFVGATTKVDLSKIGTYFFVGLIGVIILALVNALLIHSTGLELGISIVCLLLFVGVTMYDIQKINNLRDADLPEDNLAIYGALELYLDFINIFLDLLRLIGNAKD